MDDKKPANGTNFSTQDGLFPAKQGGLSSANKESNGTPGTFAHKGGFYRYGPTIKSNGAGPALTKVDRPILSQAPRVTLVGGGEIKSPQITQLVEAVKQEQEFSHFKDEIAITNLAIGKQIGIYETILNSDVFSKLFTDEEIRELQDQINTTIEQLQEVITTALNGGYEDSYTEILKQIKELYESFEGEVVKLNQNLEERTNKKTLENQVRIKKTLTQRYLNLNRRVMGLVDSGNNSDSIKVISEANSALSWLRNIQPSKVVSDKEFIDLTTALDELETKIQAEESSRVKIETTNKLPKEAITELFDSVSRFALAKAKDINNDENSKLRTEIENLLKIVNETSSPESIAALTGLITQYEEIVNAIPVKTDPDTIKPEPDTANGKVADTPQPEGEQNQEAIQEELQISVVNTKGKLVEILRGADFVRMNAEQYSLWRNRVSPAINAYNFYKSNPFGITNKNLPAAKNAFVNAYNNDINPKSRHILGLLSVFEQELQTEHDHFDGIREVNKALLESKPIVSDSTTDFAFLKESPLGLCVIARPGKTTKEEEWTWKLLSEEDSASVNTVKEAIATYVNIPNKTKALTSQKNELIELVNNYKFKEAEVKAKNFLTTISTNKAVSDVDQPVITKKEGPRSNIQINQIPSAVLRRTHIGTTPELVWQVSRDGADWETITDDEATTIQEELKSQEVFKVKSINPIHVRNMKKFGDVWKIKSTTGEWRELTDEESKNWKSVFGALTAFKKYVTSAASGNNIDSFNIALQSIGSPDLGTKKRDLIVAYQDNPLSPAIPELIENLLKEIETAKTLRSEVKEHNKKSLESGYTITDDTTQFAYTRKDPNNNNAVLIINKPKEGEPLSDSVYDWVELVGNNLISFEKASSAVTQFKNSERKSKALINAKNELIQLVNDYKFKEAEVKAEEFVKNFKTLLDTPDPFSEIKIDATTIESEPTPSTPEVSDKTVIKTPEKLETTSLRPLNWPWINLA
jgi:glycine cleavage system H lipoate-binding protein